MPQGLIHVIHIEQKLSKNWCWTAARRGTNAAKNLSESHEQSTLIVEGTKACDNALTHLSIHHMEASDQPGNLVGINIQYLH